MAVDIYLCGRQRKRWAPKNPIKEPLERAPKPQKGPFEKTPEGSPGRPLGRMITGSYCVTRRPLKLQKVSLFERRQ